MTFTGAELFLRICWVDSKGKTHSGYYLVERLVGRKLAWRLRKPLAEDQEDIDPHTVMLLKSGKATCDCEYATYKPVERCKHVLALLEKGVLPGKKCSKCQGWMLPQDEAAVCEACQLREKADEASDR